MISYHPSPDAPLQPLPVHHHHRAELQTDGSVLFRPVGALDDARLLQPHRWIDLPNEIVIRELLRLDVQDPHAVVQFTNAWGDMDLARNWDVLGPAVTEMGWDEHRSAYRLVSRRIPEDHSGAAVRTRDLLPSWAAEDDGVSWWDPERASYRHPSKLEATKRKRRGDSVGHVFQLATLLSTVRGGAQAWLADPSLREDAPLPVSAIEVGLTAYVPRIRFPVEGVDLFSALCLQLFNIIVEQLPVRRCANENCGGWFTRQRGRAEHGQSKTEGVIYCSAACAKATSQRAYRAKKRKEKSS
jgi:hypothetical protein